MAEPKPPRPRRLRRDEQRHQTRAQLLDAAERVFAREGLRGASVAAIAAEAGYSHGAIYSNFDGKEDLSLMLVEERIDARLARVYQAADAALSFAERHDRLRALIGRIVEGIARDQGVELARPRDQVATALIALANGFAIESLADPTAAPDELFAHAIAALLRGFTGSDRPGTPGDAAGA